MTHGIKVILLHELLDNIIVYTSDYFLYLTEKFEYLSLSTLVLCEPCDHLEGL